MHSVVVEQSALPCQGAPKTTLGFHVLLDGPTELRKAVVLTVMVYYSRRIQIIITKGKRYRGWNPGDTKEIVHHKGQSPNARKGRITL